MANNLKHNKFVSIPDWFGMSNSQIETPTASTKTTSVVTSSGGSASSSVASNLIYYNKFALSAITANAEILVLEDTAIIAVAPTSETSLGDLVAETGWKTTDFLDVAAGTSLTITSTIHDNYGMVFYDNTKTALNGVVFSTAMQSVTAPSNAYYFRICAISTQSDFQIDYYIARQYTAEELDLSNSNIENYLSLNDQIPEGLTVDSTSLSDLNVLVQPPLRLTKDTMSVIKLALDTEFSTENDMFEWDKTDEDNWIIRSTKPKLSITDALIEYDEENDCFLFHKSIVTSGGITMYADLGDVNIPDLAVSLPFDGTTIWYNPDTKQIEVLIKEQEDAGGLSTVLESGDGNAYTGHMLSDDGKTLTLTKGQTFLTASDLPDYTNTFVTLDSTEQYIAGIKHFTNGIYIGDKKIYQSQDDVIYLDANLVVRGGITMYATNGSVDVDSIYDGLPIDWDTIYWDESTGEKVLKAKASGGTIESVSTTGTGNAITSATLIDDGKSIQFTKGETFAKLSELTTLQDEVTTLQATVVTKADKSYVDETFVTITGEDIITGKKNFTGGLFVNDNEIIWDKSNGYWKLDGNLVVTGGITMYSTDYESGGNSGITELPIASTTELGIASFDSSSFTVTDGHVALNTKIVISSGTPSSYDTNTLYIIT